MVKKAFFYLVLITFFTNLVFYIQIIQIKNALADTKVDQTLEEKKVNGDEEELDEFEDEEDDGFEDVEYNLSEEMKPNYSGLELHGFFKEELAYRLHDLDPKLSKVRSIANLDFSLALFKNWKVRAVLNAFYDLAYVLEGRDDFDEETIRQNEAEFELRDVYAEGPLFKVARLKIGRQIIAWGESDFAQVTDIVNPRDQEELGLVDLEDARIPVTATKLTFLKDPWALDLVATHEVRPNRIGARGSDFDGYRSIRERGILIGREKVPDHRVENTEYMARLSGTFNGGDFALVGGRFYDDAAYLDFNDIDYLNGQPLLQLTPKHKEVKMYGFSGNLVSGSFLWKMEAAQYLDKAVQRRDIEEQIALDPFGESISTWEKKNTTQALVGMEYSGITDLRITLEAVFERIHDYDTFLLPDRTSKTLYFMAVYEMMNDTLDLNFQFAHLSQYNDNIYKFSVEYEFTDAWEITLGVIYYDFDNRDSQLYAYRDEDRIFVSVQYSF